LNINQEGVYRTKISDVDELKRCINSEWAGLSHTVIEYAVDNWRQCLNICTFAGGGHFALSTGGKKDDVM